MPKKFSRIYKYEEGNQNVTFKHGTDVSIFDKCHHSIIYDKTNIAYLSH